MYIHHPGMGGAGYTPPGYGRCRLYTTRVYAGCT